MNAKTGQSLPSPPDPAEVRHALDRVLGSSAFRGSKRCQDFLQFVVNRTLDGDSESLKERTLATEVFGRKATADLGDDSIVRVGAREVRKRLAQHYLTEGASDLIRIELPSGSYVPSFHSYADSPAEPQFAADQNRPHAAAPSGGASLDAPTRSLSAQGRRLLAGVLAVAIVSTAALVWKFLHRSPEEFESFWRPAFDQQAPLLLALAHPIVYHPSTRANRLNEERNGSPNLPVQTALKLPPELLNGSDFVPVFDQYAGFGDTVAAFRLSGLFSTRSKQARMRLASKVEFADLRDTPVILIGAFTNRWTAELTKSFRFRFSLYDGHKPAILDTATGKRWDVPDKSDDGRSTQDYILISRLPRSETGGFVIIGAGLTQHGTQEAGRILAQPDALAPILKQVHADKDWRSNNLEVILHTQIVGDAPGPPELVASHVW